MLDNIDLVSCQFEVYRLASFQSDEEFLHRQGMGDARSLGELKELFRSSSVRSGEDSFLDGPFRRNQFWKRKTRFSDGSFAVFYASLEIETSEAEVKHWFGHDLADVACEHPRYYWRFKCDFEGTTKDLRPTQEQRPDLMNSTDYRYCNALGLEAVRSGLDALLAPSVRRCGGTNVPVFARRALNNARRLGMVSMTVDSGLGTVAVAAVDPSAVASPRLRRSEDEPSE